MTERKTEVGGRKADDRADDGRRMTERKTEDGGRRGYSGVSYYSTVKPLLI